MADISDDEGIEPSKQYILLKRSGITDREMDALSLVDVIHLFTLAEEELKYVSHK